MKVIYIAGKYRDPRGAYYIQSNIREAERVALLVWKSGGVALCPHKNTALFDGALGIPDETWLLGDIELMKRCDAVFEMENSQESEGAQREIAVAEALGIPVLRSHTAIFKFLELI
jgi:hypothetical protein